MDIIPLDVEIKILIRKLEELIFCQHKKLTDPQVIRISEELDQIVLSIMNRDKHYDE